MTPQEFARVHKALRAYWEHDPLSEEGVRAYATELEDQEFQVVMAAIQGMAREGRDHRPPPGLVRRHVTEMRLDLPTWGEVWRTVRAASTYPARVRQDGAWVDRRMLRVREAHPAIAAFVEHLGWEQIVHALSESANSEPRLRLKWQEFCDDAVRMGTLVGIAAPPDMRRIERANRAPRPAAEAIEGVVRALRPGPPTDE